MISRYIEVITYTQIALSAAFTVLIFLPVKPGAPYIKLVGIASFLDFVAGITFLIMGNNEYYICVQAFHSLHYVIYLGVTLLIYYHAMERQATVFFWVAFVSFTLFVLVNSFYLHEFRSQNIRAQIASSLIIAILSIIYFYKLVTDLPAVNIQSLPMFWFNAGMFVYHIGNMWLLFVIMNRRPEESYALLYQLFGGALGLIRQLTVSAFAYLYLKHLNKMHN